MQTITFRAGPVQRWLERASVRVTTAGGTGQADRSNRRGREWLAPLIRREALPQRLLQQVVPGFDLDAVAWQPLHLRAFTRAVKPRMLFSAILAAAAALFMDWPSAIGVALVLLLWSTIGARQFKVLKESITHHIKEEERMMFPAARGVLAREELLALGARMRALKAELER